MPTCPTCLAMLEESGFQRSALAERLMAIKQTGSQNAAPDESAEHADPFFILNFFPELILLDKDYEGRRHPVRCTLCRSRRQPAGKIFSLDKPKAAVVNHFVRQHIMSQTHIAKMAGSTLEEQPDMPDVPDVPAEAKKPCEGANLMADNCWVSVYKQEIQLWVQHACLESSFFALHDYSWSVETGCLVAKSRSCKKLIPTSSQHSACPECRRDTFLKSCLRNVIRFAKKYHMALLLKARLFQPVWQADALVQEIIGTAVYKRHHEQYDPLMALGNTELQS